MKNNSTKFFARVAIIAVLMITSFVGTAWADTKTEGFETATSATTYNSTATIAANKSDCGITWSIYYGNVSTTSAITGAKSCLIRYYTADAKFGYAATTTGIQGLTNVTFNAKVTNTGNKMGVWYSTDGSNWTALATDVTLTTSSASKSYDIPNSSTSTTYFIKIGLTGATTNKKDLIIDDVVFTYSSGSGSTPTCATPAFSVAEGTYYETKNVEISCGTAGAAIHYTTDGTTPTSSSATYSSAISVSATTTIKAIAIKADYDDSDVASATYTIKSPIPGLAIDFEEKPVAYTDWTFENIDNTDSNISAHGGSKYGSNLNDAGNGTATASIQTRVKIEYPHVFTCYVSKTSGNTTASDWKIQVSSDGSAWTDVESQSAISMTKGDWVEFSADLKTAGYSNVYVRLYYGSSNAVRAVDDISLTTYTPSAVEAPSIIVPSEFSFSTTATITCVTDGATIYYSYDNSNWTEYTGELTITATTTIYAKAIKGGDESSISQVTTTKVLATPNVSISAATITIGGTATVSTDGPSITLTTSNSGIASVDGTTVTGVAVGEATITATWSANADYSGGNKNFAVTVIDPNSPGTVLHPYTVAQARAAIDAGTGITGVYATGIVSEIVTAYNSTYHNISYNISTDGLTTSDQLQAYRGKSFNGENFTSADDIQVGDIVVIYGNLKKYNETYEFEADNQLVSRLRPTITLSSYSVVLPAFETDGVITANYTDVETSAGIDIAWCDSNGTAGASAPSWLAVSVNGSLNVEYLVEANTGVARTAYFKVYGVDVNTNLVYSDLVTVSQAEAGAPQAGDPYMLYSGDLTEGDYIICSDGSAMNTTVDSNRLQYESVSPSNNVIYTDEASIVWHISRNGDYWNIYSPDANSYAAATGSKNQAQMLSDGADNKSLWSVSGSNTYDFVNKAREAAGTNPENKYLRLNGTYGFACYANSTGGELSLYKRANVPSSIELTAVQSGDLYWATFYNSAARYTLPEGAQAFTMNEDHELYRLGTDGSVIPANTAVIIISDAASITLTKSDSVTAISVHGGGNILRGSNYSITKTGTPYVLGIIGGVLGYYEFDGSSIPANKAYYK